MGLFQLYMQDLFRQKYAPPVMPGGVQQFGGFRGFGSPAMPQLSRPQPQPTAQFPTVGPEPGSPGLPWHIYNQA